MDEDGVCAPGTDPEVIEILEVFQASPWDGPRTSIYVHAIGERKEITENGITKIEERIVDKIYTLEISNLSNVYPELPDFIKAEVKDSEFNEWISEHFLVKDVEGQPGLASFELVY